MRWQPGGTFSDDLARERGLGEQTDYRPGEMTLAVHPSSMTEPPQRSKRSRDGPGPSHSIDSSTAALPSKKIKLNNIEVQAAETIRTLDKKRERLAGIACKVE